jgi:2-polyprenyl-3-methyl-5-hydroxy-6-metoxy-1,4-benzoquinol methylase
MNHSQTITDFNNIAYSHSWQSNPVTNLRLQKILALAGNSQRILDVGCYDGTIAKLLQNQGNTVVGIDISSSAVILAKKQGINAININIEESQIPDRLGKFDVIIAGEIIEHIFDTDAFISKLHKALKPNGRLILTTPNLAGLGSRLSLLAGKKPWMIENDILNGKSGHIRYFTFSELKNLLARQHFQVTTFTTDSVGLDTLTIPLLDRLFPSLGRIIIVQAVKL